MERKQLLSISASVLAAAWIASDAGFVLAQSSGEKKSTGGSQSERTGGDSGTPVPDKSPMGGTVEKGTGSGTSQSGMKESKRVQPDISSSNTSRGGTQSQRTGESGTPLPEGSRMGGTTDPTASSRDAQGMRRSGDRSARSGIHDERWAMKDIKDAQEALKDKGHDPGSVDGMMGPKTREAIRAFQSSNGLQATGSLNAETAKKLGVEREAISGSSRGSMDKDRSGSSSMPKDSTKRDSSAPMNK